MNVTLKWSINTVASNLRALYSCILGVTLSWFPCLPIKGGWNKHGFILSCHPVGQKVNPQLGRLVFLLSPPPSSWQPFLLLVSLSSQSCQPECMSQAILLMTLRALVSTVIKIRTRAPRLLIRRPNLTCNFNSLLPYNPTHSQAPGWGSRHVSGTIILLIARFPLLYNLMGRCVWQGGEMAQWLIGTALAWTRVRVPASSTASQLPISPTLDVTFFAELQRTLHSSV